MKRYMGAFFLFIKIIMVSDAISMDLGQPMRWMQLYVIGPHYPENTFHFHVTAEVLDDKMLIEKNACLTGINTIDVAQGLTPLHYLVARKDSTIQHIEALLKRGADPTMRTKPIVYNNGAYQFGSNAYEYAIACGGESPEHMTCENFLEINYLGNKEVMNYVLCETLYRKLSIVALQREKEEREQQQKRIRDMVRWHLNWHTNVKKIVIGKMLSAHNSII